MGSCNKDSATLHDYCECVCVCGGWEVKEYELFDDIKMDPGTGPNSISGRGLANLQVDHSTDTGLLPQHTKQVGYSVTFVNLFIWHWFS